jgi:hypothetical protein
MVAILTTFFSAWIAASLIAIMLILFRSDAYEVWEDIGSFTRRRKFVLRLIGIALLLCILPFSIPYSINNIIKRK